MQHEADVGLVDAHAEGVGGHHHPASVVDEILLIPAALVVGQARMVARGGDAVLHQLLAGLVHRLSGRAVDDAGLIPVSAHVVQHPAELVPGRFHVKIEVGAVEPRGHAEGVPQRQQLYNVRFDCVGGGGREGADHGPLGQSFDKSGDVQVAGTKILAPLGHAMGLVHGHQGDAERLAKAKKAGGRQALRGDVEYFIGAVARLSKHFDIFLGGEHGIDTGGGDAHGRQSGHLVFH